MEKYGEIVKVLLEGVEVWNSRENKSIVKSIFFSHQIVVSEVIFDHIGGFIITSLLHLS